MIAYLVLAALQTAALPATAPAATLSTAVTVPAGTAVAPGAARTASVNPDDKVICRQEEEVGTRLGNHKVCMTRAQWRDYNNQQRDAVVHAQNNVGYAHN